MENNKNEISRDIIETGKITSKQAEKLDDVYITAEYFSWTYVHTHEEMCGPYFVEQKQLV